MRDVCVDLQEIVGAHLERDEEREGDEHIINCSLDCSISQCPSVPRVFLIMIGTRGATPGPYSYHGDCG